MKTFSLLSSLILGLAVLNTFACSSDSNSSSGNGGSGGGGGVAGQSNSGGVAGATGDVSEHTYNYDDPNIVYSGRILFSADKAPRFSAPATTITARFKGIGASMKVLDGASTSNYFDVIIDDDYENATKVMADGTISLASNLPYGEHKVSIVKRTEANTGSVDFKGFVFQGEILPPPPALTRKIEIIGDSISVGSGNEALNGSANCNEDYGRPYSNASKSWGPMVARQLKAEYHVTAVSGIGALRNYNCSDMNTMPLVYDRTFVERADSPVYDHSQFVPDAVLMILGTNDFSPAGCMRPALNETVDPTNYAAYIEKLSAFLTTLRGYYPNAEFFLISSPMLHDGWPDATYTSDTSHRAAITQVAADLNATDVGAGKIHVISADYSKTKITGRGCGTHPNVFEHSIMAGTEASAVSPELILNPVKAVMGW
ncbi:MAG: SGNH/GDSL hydrolase family protein [Myxococcota bacterium]